jgi:hypothetical protein
VSWRLSTVVVMGGAGSNGRGAGAQAREYYDATAEMTYGKTT